MAHSHGACPCCIVRYRATWSDIAAMKGAREVLKRVKYPDVATRRSLYASWLRVFASNEWDDSFDGLMLDCVAATPSPTNPEKPLFADIYKARDRTIDRPHPSAPTAVFVRHRIPRLFARKPEPIEPLPTSPGIVNYLADLIRKSRTSREALDEAGLVIGFCSLALAVAAARPVVDVQAFFRVRMKRVLTAAVPTSYDGDDVFCPNRRFLFQLGHRTNHSAEVIEPFLVMLVLGQYAYHAKSGDAAPGVANWLHLPANLPAFPPPFLHFLSAVDVEKAMWPVDRFSSIWDRKSADVRFLEEGFLKQAKFGRLEVVELLYDAQEKMGLGAATINRILGESSCMEHVEKSSHHVEEFLEGAAQPMQKTRPWCRIANPGFFYTLHLEDNLDYAMRLTAVLAPDPNDLLWQRPEFGGVSAARRSAARFWARYFRRALRRGKYGEFAKLKAGGGEG
ncbi:hypothetical protein V5799_015537 [Amblyomma americanum]|uniref:Uncharacterized protein n=1 Tax=Amblyomma americanum TaxID=6943 RepID=A0AAQ4F8D3_AMBAM